MVLVAGTAIGKFGRRHDRSSFRDWIVASFSDALGNADLEVDDIDLLVVATESDLFSLQLNPAAAIASDLGLVGAAAQRVEGGGASGHLAVHVAAQAILAGVVRRVAVVGFECGASQIGSLEVAHLYGHSFDGPAEAALNIGAAGLYALSINSLMAEGDILPADLAAVAAKNHGNATFNPAAHLPMTLTVEEVMASPMIASPYHRFECAPVSDAVSVVILAGDSDAPAVRRGSARIAGMGVATDYSRLGDRDQPGHFVGKTIAAQRAYSSAAITDPRSIGVAEVYDAFSGSELQSLEALGLAPARKAARLMADGEFGRGGRMPINLSGGLLGQGGAPGATGIAQIATIARILEGRYWPDLQPAVPPQYGLADTHGGVATLCAVTVLEAGR